MRNDPRWWSGGYPTGVFIPQNDGFGDHVRFFGHGVVLLFAADNGHGSFHGPGVPCFPCSLSKRTR
jgi:hypothetical protein